MTEPNTGELGGARGIWFDSAQVRLYALARGAGRPIVFLHGGLADHRASLFHVGALASEYQLLLPDLRGSGRSVYAGELSWDQLADDVLSLLRALGIQRALVGGSSAGAGVALRFGLRHPAHALGLLLMQPAFAGEERGLNAAQGAAMQVMRGYGERAAREGAQVLSSLYERLPPALRTRALEMMRDFDGASVAATTRFLASGRQPFASARELEALRVPCLLIPGSDPEHPAEVCDLYARHLPAASLLDAASPAFERDLRAFCAALPW